MQFKIDPAATELDVQDADGQQTERARHRQWFGCMGGLILGLAIMAAGRLGQIWQALDVFSNFLIQGILVTLAFALAMFLPRFKALTGTAFAILLLVLYGAWPHLVSGNDQDARPVLQPSEAFLRVASFNASRLSTDVETTARAIESLGADVVYLTELEVLAPAVLVRLATTYPHHASCPSFPKCTSVLLSKYPYKRLTADKTATENQFDGGQFLAPFAELTVVGIHLSRFPHSQEQVTQARTLYKVLERGEKHRILVGDFNATPKSFVMETIENSTGLQRLTSLPTWPATGGLPQLAIDHILVSPQIRSLSRQRIGDNAGSDHYPVVMDLAIPSK